MKFFLPAIFIGSFLIFSKAQGQDTYIDNFGTVSYSNNNGTQNWTTNWIETGDFDTGPTAEYISISGGRLRFYWIWGETIRRSLNLSGATSATLSFDWETSSLDAGESLAIQISTDGVNYTTLSTFTGTSSNTFNQDITAYISANTTIRFLGGGSNWESDDSAFVDNVTITATSSAAITINDLAVNENAGSAVFTVTHTGADASGAFTVPYTITAGTASEGIDYTTGSGLYTGTLSFNGTAGDTEQITVLITDDFDVEPNETYTIQFGTAVGDPTVDTSDTATGTINNDDVAAVLQVGDVAVDEDAGSAIFTITHTGGPRPAAYTVSYTITAVTATEGTDYTTSSGLYTGTLNFDGSVNDTDTITVLITDDTVFETAETYTISLSASDAQVDDTDTATGTINDDEVILNDVALSLYDDFQGNFDYVVGGGTFRTNDDATDPCSISTTSSGNLTTILTPAGKTIKKAYLTWAHSSTALDQNVTFEGQAVQADLVYGAFTFGFQFYGYIADVTSIVNGLTDPWGETYNFTDLTINNTGGYCTSTVVLGAWSLMIFYEDFSLPTSTINLYYGFDATQNAGTSFTLDNFYAISPIGSKATFLSYEGDASLDGTVGTNKEELSILGQGSATPSILTGDGGQTGNNPFNSTIYDNTSGVNTSGVYGLDLDTYDISSFISITDTQVTANVDMGQDLVISSAVLLRVPSNIVSGTVFEDINYPGGAGRNITTSSGVAIPNATVQLFDNTGTLIDTEITDADGEYAFGGISDGTYTVRVVNSTVNSTRGGGSSCGACYGIQTFRSDYDGTTLSDRTNEVGGNFPSSEDVAAGTLTGAQTTSVVVVSAGGTGGIDFGFNFNTIVNTNEDGQGSLEQFIVNSNNLDETSLDIETNSIFDPAAGEDTSIFMIPTTSDPLGRTADTNFASGYFDISIPNGSPLSALTGNNTIIDARTQTAYSGDTNSGTIGSGGTTVGTSATTLPNYDLPEVQVHRNNGDVFDIQANVTIRNLSVYGGNNAAIQLNSGSAIIFGNLLGVNAQGNNAGNVDYGVENLGADITIDSNYIATNTDSGVRINGGSSNIVQNNHITSNGDGSCDDNIDLKGGSGIVIQQNLIENAASLGIDGASISGNVIITENTVTGSGQDGGNCGGAPENMGIELAGGNSQITNNIIYSNGGAGIATTGSGTGNLISQNSIYANGTASAALGIDLSGDGVTINDNGDSDSGSNTLLNFPIIDKVFMSGSNLLVNGWSRSGASVEFFISDISEGTATAGDNQLGLTVDYGEGQTYLATFVEGSGDDSDATSSAYSDADGNADTTNRFQFTVPVPSGTTLGDMITATATLGNSTSEFAPVVSIRVSTVITNRRITYRVNQN